MCRIAAAIETMNYLGDHRVAALDSKWWRTLNESKRTVTVTLYRGDGEEDDQDVTLPVKFEACDTCEGSGKHVNPSIDCGGISGEDFDRDPDFREEYFSGRYDVTCYGCRGKRVVPAIDLDRCNADQRNAVDRLRKQAEEDAEFRSLQASEARMGA